MDVEILTMPRLGESVTEGTITAWLKSVGDQVEIDDPLIEVSTEKVDSEIPSPFEGILLEILVPQGETVAVDTPLARIGPAEAAGGAAPAPAAEPAPAAAPSPAPAAARPAPAMATVGAPAPAPPRPNGGGRSLLSPVVRRLADEYAVDLGTVAGSGEGGRIMREDIEAAIAAGPAPAAAATPAAAAPGTAAPTTPAPVGAAPAQPARAPTAAPAAGVTEDRTEVVALSRIRLVTAERMVESLRIAPHVFTSIEVDLERVEEVRQRHKDRFRKEEGAGLTYLVFIARAVCDALRAFPTVNASVDIDTKTMSLHHFVNLGIAVDLDEQGLAVPVIRDADSLNLRGLARAIRAKAEGARTRTLPPDDYAGSTFTITSPGAMGDYTAAPIINQPNVAILAAPVVSRRPVAVGDAVAIHHMTILGFCYDHRAFDGVTASRFMAYVRDALQARDWEAELG